MDIILPLLAGLSANLGAALKGKQTLFYAVSQDVRKEFDLHRDNRAFLSNLLNAAQAESTPKGYGAFFLVGDDESAAIHSEPPIHEERLFISVLPGRRAGNTRALLKLAIKEFLENLFYAMKLDKIIYPFGALK